MKKLPNGKSLGMCFYGLADSPFSVNCILLTLLLFTFYRRDVYGLIFLFKMKKDLRLNIDIDDDEDWKEVFFANQASRDKCLLMSSKLWQALTTLNASLQNTYQ